MPTQQVRARLEIAELQHRFGLPHRFVEAAAVGVDAAEQQERRARTSGTIATSDDERGLGDVPVAGAEGGEADVVLRSTAASTDRQHPASPVSRPAEAGLGVRPDRLWPTGG